jgi:uncharacterized protein YjbI with pentapeptide repeats
MPKKGPISGRNREHQKRLPKKALPRDKKRKIQVYETVVLGAEDEEQLRGGEKGPKIKLPALDAGEYRITVRHVGSRSVEGRPLKLIPNRSHLVALKRGAHSWNEWRRKNHTVRPNLRGISLPPGIDLYKADLSEADLTGATLERANLSRALLYSSKLVAANLKGANLHGAQLDHSDFSGANLAEAELVAATFTGAILTGTYFRNSLLGSTSLDAVDLSTARGLDTIRHAGPSSIGTDTIYLSKASISEIFLRGAGVPDGFVTYMKSLVVNPIEYYSCFISYSNKDKDFAERLHADLQNAHVRSWFFPENARWGRGVWEAIDEPIRKYDKLIVICSENSLQSGPVLREVERALRREDDEGKNILFPVRIDEYLFEKWEHPFKSDVLSKVVADFRQWRNHDGYRKAFERLLRALKEEDKPKQKMTT